MSLHGAKPECKASWPNVSVPFPAMCPQAAASPATVADGHASHWSIGAMQQEGKRSQQAGQCAEQAEPGQSGSPKFAPAGQKATQDSATTACWHHQVSCRGQV